MRVLAIYPSFDARVNEMAMLWKHLCAQGWMTCTVFARKHDVLKGHTSELDREEGERLVVHRFPALSWEPAMLEAARAARPHLIFCAVAHNLGLARRLADDIHVPIVLHTEYFLDNTYLVRRRYSGGLPPLAFLEGSLYRAYLQAQTQLVFSSDPREFVPPQHAGSPHVRYLPWPTMGDGIPVPADQRDHNLGVYVGSQSAWKGTADLRRYWRHVLTMVPDFRLVMVGSAVDEEGARTLEELPQEFPGRVEVRPPCPREEAMHLLRQAFCVFLPGNRFGWGQILDAWGNGTPVITRREHFDLVAGSNCLLAASPELLVQHVVALRENPDLVRRMQRNGLEEIRRHSSERSSSSLRRGLVDSLNPRVLSA